MKRHLNDALIFIKTQCSGDESFHKNVTKLEKKNALKQWSPESQPVIKIAFSS